MRRKSCAEPSELVAAYGKPSWESDDAGTIHVVDPSG